jgi:ABC-type sugar transport system ATPase subunit
VADDILRMENINKSFPGVQALDDVTFRVEKGTIHALVGENGAGKSTLMKLLAGTQPKDSGTIEIDGETVELEDPAHAQRLGVGMIYQELTVVPYLTVGQNIYLGREPRRAGLRLMDWKKLYGDAAQMLDRIELPVQPKDTVADLSVAQQQMIEVAKALSLEARIIIMDEPTSSLTDRETTTLFTLMRNLREEGITIIFISHRLEEVFEIADRVTVLRDGKTIDTKDISEVERQDVVNMMVGRELDEMFPKQSTPTDEVVLEVEGLTGPDGEWFRDISFQLRAGEILGISGLVGAGRSEMARALLGLDPLGSGTVKVRGEAVRVRGIRDLMKRGFAYVPEDRKTQGLFLGMTVRENITISVIRRVFKTIFISIKRLVGLAEDYVESLDIETPGVEQTVRNLSGGNQQKVIIARGLTLKPRVFIMDEPTRGIDVGAKAEIHGLMDRLAGDGVGMIMISSELPEILGVSDRILVMREGDMVGEFSREEATQDKIMSRAAGGETAGDEGTGGDS